MPLQDYARKRRSKVTREIARGGDGKFGGGYRRMTTPYHARFFAHELTRQGDEGLDRVSRSLFDACVDLNPHQIEAALFAMRSPVPILKTHAENCRILFRIQ